MDSEPISSSCSPEQTVVYLKTVFHPTMRYAVNIVSLIVIPWATCSILAGYFTCIPTEKLWHPMIEGGCVNLSRFYYGLQMPNITTDTIIPLLPMHIAQKLGLSGILILRFLWVLPAVPMINIPLTSCRTLIFDTIRLVVLIELSTKGDHITCTHNKEVSTSVWTCIEPAVGIIASCLSNMRPLFKVMHTKVWSRLSSRYATNTDSNKNSQTKERSGWPRQTTSLTDEGGISPSPCRDLNQSPTQNQSNV
ncbi:hypothetical protein N7537_003917 [Penicillium hordei]|uniref:Rhodopsin domain-containing protein n=1 Tax=Penicillium hordei TaxID=40994 RepID=A0AAD6EB25_9EURO|nr:uncharacterized protein N7537_003917 [Penicillium hordei]KAJ5607298.1 hypothetical protein N7537_003917 [Penicillium hordei]